MIGRPEIQEAAPYYSAYIDRISSPDVVAALHDQVSGTLELLRGISEEKSLYRYAPDKWTIREMLSHVNDGERIFLHRALWFARGFTEPLPGFDQDVAVVGGKANEFSWASLVDEFEQIRTATLAFFRNLPEEAWLRTGVASDNPFTVRALAYIIAGHVSHHEAVLRERYL